MDRVRIGDIVVIATRGEHPALDGIEGHVYDINVETPPAYYVGFDLPVGIGDIVSAESRWFEQRELIPAHAAR